MTKPSFIDGLSSLANDFDAFMIDQYGVMHDGHRPYPGAVDAMTRLTAMNKSVIVLTNAGTRATPNILGVEAIGFPRASFSALMSSGEVTWQGLRTGAFGAPFESGGRVCILGKAGEDYGLDELDLIFVTEPEAADFIVVAGSDCPQTSLDHYSNILAPAAAKHIPALCANPDRMTRTSDGMQPSSGAIADVYVALGGRVVHVGKPYPAIYREALKRAGVPAARVLCVGDSLDHDIFGGATAGFHTALVRTGLLEGASDAQLATMVAASAHVPDYVLPSLSWTVASSRP